MLIQSYLLIILPLFLYTSAEIKPKITLDEFFNYTTFPLLRFSPTGQYLLYQTRRPSWNTNSFENAVWLYNIETQTKKLLTTNLHKLIKPQWSPTGNFIAIFPRNYSLVNKTDDPHTKPQSEQHIYLYSIISEEMLYVQVGRDTPLAFTWSDTDSFFYMASVNFGPPIEEGEWKDAVQYRKNILRRNSTIYRVDLTVNNRSVLTERHPIRNVSSLIDQLIYVRHGEKLVVSSVAAIIENLGDFELYLMDLRDPSTLLKLTNNEAYEMELQLSPDRRHIIFRTFSITSNKYKANNTQYRLYALNLYTKQLFRLAEHFRGSINGFTPKYDSGVYILGQVGTSVQIYSQGSPEDHLIYYNGWIGTYESIVSSHYNGAIAFVHSSLEKPMEIYLIDNISQLKTAQAITNENNLYIQRDLPQAKVYSWKNNDDHRVIEGILHYPPGKFLHKNLPLFVLIHGGPYLANLNRFELLWHNWATLAASEGWLVLEPNYRGSTGYGDQFLSEIRYKPLSRPGKDILFGIDRLIKDQIVNPHRLTVGGYSYGGLLTNWLITQTRRFNAALSGAGVADYTSVWGTMDLPVMIGHLFGGYPWEVPHTYQNESPIYQLNRVRTPTHIITGESDVRVPASQSYILERGLHYLGIPVKLVTFPKEGHSLNNNPWYGKIKVREELKWLQKYGNQSLNHNEYSNNSRKLKLTSGLQLYIFLFVIIKSM